MSEEEIIEIIEKIQCEYKEQQNDKKYNDYTVFKAKEYLKGLQGLLDLYNKEKLNSFNLSEQLNKEKEKNKWKPISKYNREKYDWVLVKYFDGEYECVPEVAEQRWDGKWYTTEREIPFEVKYFFDMQELLEE